MKGNASDNQEYQLMQHKRQKIIEFKSFCIQSQKTQAFCVGDFATLSDERRSRSKIFLLFIWIKEPCVRQFEGLARSKLLGISQTTLSEQYMLRI